jgi:hypothetical protein
MPDPVSPDDGAQWCMILLLLVQVPDGAVQAPVDLHPPADGNHHPFTTAAGWSWWKPDHLLFGRFSPTFDKNDDAKCLKSTV